MIWIIDDDDIFKFVTTFQLQKIATYQKIQLFADISSAFESLKTANELPEYILLDINFPDLSGWDFLDRFILHFLNLAEANTKIYMVSSSISKTDKDLLENYAFVQGLLQKPIKNEDLENIFKPSALANIE